MDQFTKEGRKLRPRKTSAQSHSNFEKVEYRPSAYGSGENQEAGEYRPRQYSSERRSNYGESRGNYGERRNNYGESRGNYGERRQSYSGGRSNSGYGERRPRQYNNDGQRSSYGESRGNYGESRSNYGERRNNYGESRGNYGERRQSYSGGRSNSGYGERRPRQYNNDGQGGSYGESRGNYGESRNNYGERRSSSYGGPRRNFQEKNFQKRPGNKKRPGKKAAMPPTFNKNTFEGINRMIERRPVVNGNESSENYDSPIKDVIRLNKFIANSGVCSRREADTLIQAGVVTVNGEVVTELGTKINIHEDDVRFNGERLKGEDKVYIIMNKPKGFVTTASDPHADKTVVDLIKGCPARVYPVGRLDKNTTGVLMLTNDGEIAERLTHPSYDKKKIYQVALDRALTEEDYNTILTGVTLTDGEEKADELEYIDPNDKRKLGIEIHSGKNRIVRRIFESLGYSVKALDRVYFAGLTKKGLKKGEWRFLTEGEANILKMGAYI